MSIVLLLIVTLAIAGGAVELGLRTLFGFGRPPLYMADPQMGYRLVPNQRLKRFGNRLEINQFSMRGGDISPTRPADTLRILLLGDSVANGGWWTDQSATISNLMQTHLNPLTQTGAFKQIEVLNASANSWGPRNELAYVNHFGHFEAQWVVLLINTDDLFATAPTSVQVGRDRNYPDRNPPLAILEVLSRLTKPAPIPELVAVQQESGDRVGVNLAAVYQLQQTLPPDSRLLLAMTPLLREVSDSGPRDYELVARQRVQKYTADAGILYLDFLPQFNDHPEVTSLYRDHIHLSPAGNAFVSQAISRLIQDHTQQP